MSSSSDCDFNLDGYRERLSSSLHDNKIKLLHNFLNVRDETIWEAVSLFGQKVNVDNIADILQRFGHKCEEGDELAIVASVGTSSTQAYSRNTLIGNIQSGTTAMRNDPTLAGLTLRQLLTESKRKGINVPLVLTNSIGYFVKQSVNIATVAENHLADYASEPKEVSDARKKGDAVIIETAIQNNRDEMSNTLQVLKELRKVAHEECTSVPCIIWSKAGEAPRKLDNGWVDTRCNQLVNEYPHGVYVVDFGGGGPDLQFYKPGQGCASVKKSRFMLNKQESFVTEMIKKRYDNEIFLQIVAFLSEEISKHAHERDCTRDENDFPVCLVYQTGMARQQAYLGHTNPVAEITSFVDDQVCHYLPFYYCIFF